MHAEHLAGTCILAFASFCLDLPVYQFLKGWSHLPSPTTTLLLLSEVDADARCVLIDWRIPTRGFPSLTQSMYVPGKHSFHCYTNPRKMFFFKGAIYAQTYRQAGSHPSQLLAASNAAGLHWQKGQKHGESCLGQPNPSAGHRSTGRFMHAKAGGRPFLPFKSVYRGALENRFPLPTRISKTRTECRSFSLAGNQVMQGTGSVFPSIYRQLSSHSRRMRRRNRHGPGGHFVSHPQKDLMSCSATAHKYCPGFWAPQLLLSPACWPHWVALKHSLQDSTTWWTVAQISEAS